jgi:hypothetical protein
MQIFLIRFDYTQTGGTDMLAMYLETITVGTGVLGVTETSSSKQYHEEGTDITPFEQAINELDMDTRTNLVGLTLVRLDVL